jgi:hypothetical protein
LVIAILWLKIVAQYPPVLDVETIIVRIPDVLHADFAKHPLRRFIFGAHHGNNVSNKELLETIPQHRPA